MKVTYGEYFKFLYTKLSNCLEVAESCATENFCVNPTFGHDRIRVSWWKPTRAVACGTDLSGLVWDPV